ncbi:MAG TPA: enoyl-CoA hydratase [Spongiibacteraceae bacterium]|nr:enoyl-CoA hydratase [Spongiibacteraceae bacterium]HCS27460.1 enoyl-CoA hydratase [Spongiibacteraceae bacterium]
MSDTQEVLVSVEDGVMTVIINRPEARNAATKAVAEGIAAAMDELDSNNDIRVAIISGAGGTFCAGMDLKGFLKGEIPVVEGRGFAGVAEAPPKKPLIAAVEGYALAGGCELALACDLIVASEEAKFGISEVKRGLVAAGGGLLRLPRQIAPRLALEMALTGEPIDGKRAAEIGLANRAVPAGSALAEAKKLAALIVKNAPLALIASKRVMVEQQDWSTEEMFARQGEIVNPVFGTEDAQEGAVAFAEKRAPVWKSK